MYQYQIAIFRGELHAEVLELLMRHFDFAFTRLDHAFRCLCKKILLKAESQQLDRVIRAFAQRYWECHRDPFYRNAGKKNTKIFFKKKLIRFFFFFVRLHWLFDAGKKSANWNCTFWMFC